MAALASTAFAADFSITGQATTNASRIWPVIGAEIDLGNVDILFGFSLGITINKENKGLINEDRKTYWELGFYGGVAPEIDISSKVSISFPILFDFTHFGEKIKYKNGTPANNIVKKIGYNRFAIDVGARFYFNITEKWGVFSGIRVSPFSIYTQRKATTFGGASGKDGYVDTYFFRAGYIDLGVKYTF